MVRNKNGSEITQPKTKGHVDYHWKFLEEIEAPMWVDLTLECESAYEDKDDEWFKISHPFHQCSSRKLKNAFSALDEGSANSDIVTEELSSPKVPSSVLKSRGKQYKIRVSAKEKHKAPIVNKRHPVTKLGEKASRTTFESNKRSVRDVKEITGVKSDSEANHSFSATAAASCSSSGSGCGNSRNRSYSSVASKVNSNSPYTIPSEASRVDRGSSSSVSFKGVKLEQQRTLERSSQVNGDINGLLSSLRVALRKSRVMRESATIKVYHERKPEGSKSSSNESSFCSSSNTSSLGKNMATTLMKEKTPESINIMTNHQISNVNLNVALKGDRSCRTNGSLPNNSGILEAKGLRLKSSPKVLVTHKANEHSRIATVAKTKQVEDDAYSKRFLVHGKENEARCRTVSNNRQNCPTAAVKDNQRTRSRKEVFRKL